MSLTFSFEFWPPADSDGQQKLLATAAKLGALSPAFYSVTFGATGAAQAPTEAVVSVLSDACPNVPVTPHLSCVGATEASILETLTRYQARGIRQIVVLRGDAPTGAEKRERAFPYAADLVRYIRKNFGQTFRIIVACYPEVHPDARSATADLDYFKAKVDAGADAAITQFFYSAEAFYDFYNRCQIANITIPIIPGIMPIYQAEKLLNFANKCGADIPKWLRLRLADYAADKAALQAFGVDYVSLMCLRLQEMGVSRFHFFTLNMAKIVERILTELHSHPTE